MIPHTIDSSILVWTSISSCNVVWQVVKNCVKSLSKGNKHPWLSPFPSPRIRFLEKFPFLCHPLFHWFDSLLRIASFLSGHYTTLFFISKGFYLFLFPFLYKSMSRSKLEKKHIKNWLTNTSSYLQDQWPVSVVPTKP